MTSHAISEERTALGEASRSVVLSGWVARLTTVGILGIGAFAKFFNYTEEGSKALAEGLGVGRGTVTLIGAVETLAVILILIPRTRAVGALLAIGTMGGALFSHATKLGWSGNAAAEMWPLALVALAAGTWSLWTTRRELPILGEKL